ncbi:voltage-gated hydrogen channel 1 [Galendromus occidentalis]|uniref:Voltage-gated hydrogen channel 1 n=1 Tax=Galendromus occidentalis TaxID=34638 RepID=A0AAJ6QN08_9ACAR|nr:voltage-gated hydrogen channel 1 [Galendromus occidentalis]
MSITSVDLTDVSRGPPSEAATDLKKHENGRERLRRLLHSQRFQLIVCVLIILDIIFIIVELLAEMKFLETNILELPEHSLSESQWAHWARRLSITVLFIFLIEIFVKVYAFGCIDFFKHKLEVFDAFIVVTSLIFDLTFHRTESAASIGSGLIITLRLWRVGRLLNGIVLTVKMQAERQLEKEIQLREDLKQKMMTQRDYCNALEQDNKYLRQLLAENRIRAPLPVDPPHLEIPLNF